MRNNQRINAFTVLEITITMVITAILVTLVYSSINFLAKQNFNELRTKTEINQWMIMRQQIMQDVYTSHSLEKLPNGILLHKPNVKITYYEENGQLFITKNENSITTDYNGVSFDWTLGKDEETSFCELTIPVRSESMKLHFLTFSDNSDRINKWFKSEMINGRD
ncbi:MAG: type II secretion system protein [Brumimicrobium sp.]